MNSERDFVRSLSSFLALHTEQSSAYLAALIESFMRSANTPSSLEPPVKEEVKRRLRAEMAAHNNVPSFLHFYLIRHLERDAWSPQAAFIASRYLRRRSGERFVSWERRHSTPEHAVVA